MQKMKWVFFFMATVVSFQGQASYLVPAYNNNYCPVIDSSIAVVITTSDDGSHFFQTQNLINSVSQWDSAFKGAGDLRLNLNKAPLCIGLMYDWGAPNAGALGTSFILMGQNLLHNISVESLGNIELENITKKFVLAHEYAHYLQNLYQLKFEYILPMLSVKIKEQHADCMAAYMLRLNNQLNDTLSNELEGFIASLADAHIVGDHGTAEQRVLAYKSGSALSRLNALSGKTVSTTTASDVIKACGNYYAPTSGNTF